MNRFQKWLYPELHTLERRPELLYRVRELVQRESFRPVRRELYRKLVYVIVFISIYLMIWWTLPRLQIVPRTVGQVGPIVLGLAGGWLGVLANRSVQRRTIRRAMVRCGIPICIPCGYDLSETDPSDPCPECGTAYPELGDPATALRLNPKERTT